VWDSKCHSLLEEYLVEPDIVPRLCAFVPVGGEAKQMTVMVKVLVLVLMLVLVLVTVMMMLLLSRAS
jgi:hypothetical protein